MIRINEQKKILSAKIKEELTEVARLEGMDFSMSERICHLTAENSLLGLIKTIDAQLDVLVMEDLPQVKKIASFNRTRDKLEYVYHHIGTLENKIVELKKQLDLKK